MLFREAKEKGYFVKNRAGEDYLFDFGEYDCGVVDLTMPEASVPTILTFCLA